jgi:hypothetical protein
MNTEILKDMEINAVEFFGESTYVVRTGENTYSVCDNGEEVPGCNLETAIRIIDENLS